MFPGMGKMDAKQMQAMMRQFGIKSTVVEAKRVVIEMDGKKLVLDQPQVTAVEMQGQKTYTIMGQERIEESADEDVQLLVEQTGVNAEIARTALLENENDLAKALEQLKKK